MRQAYWCLNVIGRRWRQEDLSAFAMLLEQGRDVGSIFHFRRRRANVQNHYERSSAGSFCTDEETADVHYSTE